MNELLITAIVLYFAILIEVIIFQEIEWLIRLHEITQMSDNIVKHADNIVQRLNDKKP